MPEIKAQIKKKANVTTQLGGGVGTKISAFLKEALSYILFQYSAIT